MRTVLPFVACLALATSVAGSASAGRPAPSPPPVAAAAAAAAANDATKANDFNFAMYGALRREKGNLFFSGTSMREALGIAYLGAHGDTAAQMASTLRLDPDAAKSADLARTEIADFATAKGTANLTIANRLWVDTRFPLKAPFSSAALRAYGSPTDPVDFFHQADPTRIRINDWVAKQTNDKIKDLLPAGSIQSDTRLVITNAIWFKGDWQNPFDKSATHDEAFLADGTTATKTAMMHQTTPLALSSVGGAKMLEMKYGKSDLAMDVLLPDSNTGLPAIEDAIVSGGIGKWTAAMTWQTVNVSFPKLTFTWSGSIKQPLTQLGMARAFHGSQADLTGIADVRPGENLYISDVVHKAFVAVDEKGTEAAAATGVIVAATTAISAPQQTVTFTADHPFIVIIRDVKQNRILFTGRVTNPKV